MALVQSHLCLSICYENDPSNRVKPRWSRRSYQERLHIRRLRPITRQEAIQFNNPQIQETADEQH